MSDSNWRDRGPALVVIAALISIVLVVWLEQPVRQPEPTINNPQINQSQNSDIITSEPPFYPWRDSIAQWSMAVLGAAATIISIFALVWLRLTWDQTKRNADAAWRAVEVASEGIRNEQRPWIQIEICNPFPVRIVNDKIAFWPQGTIKNIGHSPAVDAHFSYWAYPTSESLGIENFRQDVDSAMDQQSAFGRVTILPNRAISVGDAIGPIAEISDKMFIAGRYQFFFAVACSYRYKGIDELLYSSELYVCMISPDIPYDQRLPGGIKAADRGFNIAAFLQGPPITSAYR